MINEIKFIYTKSITSKYSSIYNKNFHIELNHKPKIVFIKQLKHFYVAIHKFVCRCRIVRL